MSHDAFKTWYNKHYPKKSAPAKKDVFNFEEWRIANPEIHKQIVAEQFIEFDKFYELLAVDLDMNKKQELRNSMIETAAKKYFDSQNTNN